MNSHFSTCNSVGCAAEEKCSCEALRYFLAARITAAVIVCQIVVAVLFGSLALLSDSIHAASDFITITGSFVVAIICFYSAGRHAGDRLRKVFAYFGVGLLLCGTVFVLLEAYDRFLDPVDLTSWPVIITAAMGGAGNYLVHRMLHAVPEEDHNHTHRTMSVHVFADLVMSLAVILSAVVIYFSGIYEIDLLISAGIACYMVYLSIKLYLSIRAGDCRGCCD